MIDVIFFLIYRWLLIPCAVLLLKLTRFFWPEKIQQMLRERSTPQRPVLWARPIWIHASSGEIEYAKPVLRELRQRFPQIPLLVTYFSPSAHRLIKGTTDFDFFLPVPFDQHQAVRRFIDYANPLAVLFSRTDVWPELALQLRQRQIPTLLFSATLSANSSRGRGAGKFLSRFALNQLTEIFCVNEEDQQAFTDMGVVTATQVVGDTRFDQVIYRLHHPMELKTHLRPADRPVLVAGSTWPQDEDVLLPALSQLVKKNLFVILAPHEISESRLARLQKNLQDTGLRCQRYSQASEVIHTDVLIIDQIGILPEIYSWGNVGFVGGSFKDRVHSVMEPLAAGLPVIVGPHHQNNREALHFALKFISPTETMVSNVNSTNEFIDRVSLLLKLCQDPLIPRQIKEQVHQHAGVSRQVAQWPPLVRAIDLAQSSR